MHIVFNIWHTDMRTLQAMVSGFHFYDGPQNQHVGFVCIASRWGRTIGNAVVAHVSLHLANLKPTSCQPGTGTNHTPSTQRVFICYIHRPQARDMGALGTDHSCKLEFPKSGALL